MRLKFKIIALSLGSLVLYMAISNYQFYFSLQQQMIGIRKGFLQNQQILQSSLVQVFYNLYHNAQVISKNETLKTQDPEKVKFVLNEMVNLYQVYDYMSLYDKNGKLIATNDIAPDGKKLNLANLSQIDVKDMKWFKAAVEMRFTEDIDKKIFGSYVGSFGWDPIAESLYGEKKFGQHFTTIIDDGYGEVLGVLSTYAGARWVNQEISGLVSTFKKNGQQGLKVLVLDKENKVIYGDQAFADRWEKEHKNIIEKLKNIESNPFALEDDLWAYGSIESSKFLNQLNWKIVLNMDVQQFLGGVKEAKNIFYISLLITAITIFIAIRLGNKISGQINEVAREVMGNSLDLSSAGSQLSKNSEELEVTSTANSGNILQTKKTISSINEIIVNNVENCRKTEELSLKNQEIVIEGQKTIGEMSQAIEKIQLQNEAIMSAINKNHEDMRGITNFIADIKQKTKIIQDIVLETKLISFNASVEAARAGIHGQGFAIVAEEIGKLALMSGKASDEIERLLDQSVKDVEEVISQTNANVQGILNDGRLFIDEGVNVVNQNQKIFAKILHQTEVMRSEIKGIVDASKIQKNEFMVVTRSMEELDSSIQRNMKISDDTLQSSAYVNKQVQSLKSAAQRLLLIVDGKTSENNHPEWSESQEKDHVTIELSKDDLSIENQV